MLTDERLAVIRAMITLTDVGDAQFNAITDLLAEVEQLREASRIVDAMEIVQMLTPGQTLCYSEQPDGWVCALCGASTPSEWGQHAYSPESESERARHAIQHDSDCPVMKARALLSVS